MCVQHKGVCQVKVNPSFVYSKLCELCFVVNGTLHKYEFELSLAAPISYNTAKRTYFKMVFILSGSL